MPIHDNNSKVNIPHNLLYFLHHALSQSKINIKMEHVVLINKDKNNPKTTIQERGSHHPPNIKNILKKAVIKFSLSSSGTFFSTI